MVWKNRATIYGLRLNKTFDNKHIEITGGCQGLWVSSEFIKEGKREYERNSTAKEIIAQFNDTLSEDQKALLVQYERTYLLNKEFEEFKQKINEMDETIQISNHDLKMLLDNGCGFYSIDVILDCGGEIHIERGDVDSVLVFEEVNKND